MFENTDSTLVPFVDTQRTGHRRGRILWQEVMPEDNVK